MKNHNNDIQDFLLFHTGTWPDETVTLSTEFEVGGSYENWGFIIKRGKEILGSGRSVSEAVEHAKQKLKKNE